MRRTRLAKTNCTMTSLSHKFVETIPDDLDDGVLYISMEYATVIHKCCCGCQSRVVTPLSPKDWRLSFDGKTISLYPSIGNWSFPCQSHYWITNSMVRWAPKWTKRQIERSRKKNECVSKTYHKKRKATLLQRILGAGDTDE